MQINYARGWNRSSTLLPRKQYERLTSIILETNENSDHTASDGRSGSRSLGLVKSEQLIGEAHYRPCPFSVLSPDRLWQRVIGPVREGVAIDDQERPGA